MTNGEVIAAIGVGGGLLLNFAGIVWGASKLSSAVSQVKQDVTEIKGWAKDFLRVQDDMKKVLDYHNIAIALICNETGIKIRRSDLGVHIDD